MKYMFVVPLFVLATLTGCTQLEEIQREQQQELTCQPVDANGCIGFLTDKPIMLEDEV
jgi:hypothetical protein|tara:strand:- start:527 stop:700 length:174 start_codon:yes stop_codon:yes gene_type:complete